MSHQQPLVMVGRRLWIRHVAIGLAAVVGVVPASSAQAPQVPGQGKSAGTAIEAEEQQMNQRPGSKTRASVAVPNGRVGAVPEDGEPIYVRRTTVRPGITIVEVSTTPFVPVLPAKEQAATVVRSDQPASW